MPSLQNKKIIYLTFDDGPNEPYTSQVLDILKQYNAKATFFVVGKNIERHPQILKRIVDEGHSIGIHSYSHNFFKVIFGRMLAETLTTKQLIYKYSGVDTLLYRSPWGITVPWFGTKIKKLGYKIYHWDIMLFDWVQPATEFMAQHLVNRAFNGAIVLMHDGDQISLGRRDKTIETLQITLTQLQAQGYEFAALESVQTTMSDTVRNLVKDNWAYWKNNLATYWPKKI